jgi:hypothetical protein
MIRAVKPGSYVVAQEPITSAGRIGGKPLSMPDARHPDIGAMLPELFVHCGCELIDAWAEAPAWFGEGPVSEYLSEMTEVDSSNESIVLPPVVTVVGRSPHA